jgi:hypothetical protein
MLAPVSSAKRRGPIERFPASPVGNETYCLANCDGFNTAVSTNGIAACAREDVRQLPCDKFGPHMVTEGDVAVCTRRRRSARSAIRPGRRPLKPPFCAIPTRSPSRFARAGTTALPGIRAPKREGFARRSRFPDRKRAAQPTPSADYRGMPEPGQDRPDRAGAGDSRCSSAFRGPPAEKPLLRRGVSKILPDPAKPPAACAVYWGSASRKFRSPPPSQGESSCAVW